MATARPQHGIKSLETGVRLFLRLRDLNRPAALTEISGLAGMHPAKAHRYFVSLGRTGLVQQDERGLYCLGPLARPEDVNAELEQAMATAVSGLSDLVRELGETVFVSKWGHTGPKIVEVGEPLRPVSIRPTTTQDLPLLNSATGRAFAAYIEEERRGRLVNLALNSLPGREKLSDGQLDARRRAFDRHLAETRRHRLARTTGERYPGLISFSAPVFDSRGAPIVAFTSFGMRPGFDERWSSELPRALRSHAFGVTKRIGGRLPD